MGKRLIVALSFFLPLMTMAQDSLSVAMVSSAVQPQARFGYLSYSAVIRQMPDYVVSQAKLQKLQDKYDAELARADREFNLKFAEFIDGQNEFPENIMRKRQKELQDLMEKSLHFKAEIKELIKQARSELNEPIVEHLNALIGEVGKELNLQFVLNTDNNACPFINTDCGVDITTLVKEKAGIK